jgi:hypothetical protein
MRRFTPCAQQPGSEVGPRGRFCPGAIGTLAGDSNPIRGGLDPYSGSSLYLWRSWNFQGTDCVHGDPDSLVKSLSISLPWTRGSTGPTIRWGQASY